MSETVKLPEPDVSYEAARDDSDLRYAYSADAVQEIVREALLAERQKILALVLDDAWAMTFQTFGQYRTALAAAIRRG